MRGKGHPAAKRAVDLNVIQYHVAFSALKVDVKQDEPLAEFPEGEEFAVVLVCGGARLRLVLA